MVANRLTAPVNSRMVRAMNRAKSAFWGLWAIACWVLIAFTAAPGFAASKVALIIGNNSYVHAPALDNPVNDARAVAKLLRSIGFDVMEHYDVGKADAGDIMEAFAKKTTSADVGLVYFAGHGIQVSGTTYLVPTDVSLDNNRDLRKLIPADHFLEDAAQAAKLGVVILDACRDNPFIKRLSEAAGKSRSMVVGRGLSRIGDVPKNSMIAYATQAGNVALDGTGGVNSPYAAALVKHLGAPNKDIRLVFGAVRDDVIKATEQKQEPFTYGSLGGTTIYLNEAAAAAQPAEPEGASAEREIAHIPTEQLHASAPVASAFLAWKSATTRNSWDELSALRRKPDPGIFPMLAGHLISMRSNSPGLSVADALGALHTQRIAYAKINPGLAEIIQGRLRDLNYYGGALDGQFGQDSRAAFEAFIRDHRLGRAATAAAIVTLAEQAAVRAAQSPLTGLWRGKYFYPRPVNGIKSVAFEMDLTFSQGSVTGFVSEPNTFGDATSKNLYADFDGRVMGNQVEWKKTYDGTGGAKHSVWYRGTLDRERRAIDGTWKIRADWSGKFHIELR